MAGMNFVVYELHDPRMIAGGSASAFYVGKSSDASQRLAKHLFDARAGKNSPCSERIRDILASGQRPQVVVRSRHSTEVEALGAEIAAIASFPAGQLTNLTVGGEGGRHGATGTAADRLADQVVSAFRAIAPPRRDVIDQLAVRFDLTPSHVNRLLDRSLSQDELDAWELDDNASDYIKV